MDTIKSLIHSATFGKLFRAYRDDQLNCSSLLHLGKVSDFYAIMRCRRMPPDANVKYGTAGEAFVFSDGGADALGSVKLWKFLLVTLKLLTEVTILGWFLIHFALMMYFVVVRVRCYREVRRKAAILSKRKISYDRGVVDGEEVDGEVVDGGLVDGEAVDDDKIEGGKWKMNPYLRGLAQKRAAKRALKTIPPKSG